MSSSSHNTSWAWPACRVAFADYPDGFAYWNWWSSLGAYITAAGTLVFVLGALEAHFIRRQPASDNPWGYWRNDAGVKPPVTSALPQLQHPAKLSLSGSPRAAVSGGASPRSDGATKKRSRQLARGVRARPCSSSPVRQAAHTRVVSPTAEEESPPMQGPDARARCKGPMQGDARAHRVDCKLRRMHATLKKPTDRS
jgi:hypothetical protein